MKRTPHQLTANVNIVVALDCEAKPLVSHFNLKRHSHHSAFAVYGDGQHLTLIVSGPGKLAMSSACGYLYGAQCIKDIPLSAWLNVGIAGHKDLELGVPMLIHKVTDVTIGRRFYPPFQLDTDMKSCELLSVDSPESTYSEDCAYDMEGSAFYGTASRFVTSELVQIVKIVSDNRENPANKLSKEKVQQLLHDQLAIIETVVGQLSQLAGACAELHGPVAELADLSNRLQLTTSHKIQLSRLIRQLRLLNARALDGLLQKGEIDTPKAMITALEKCLEDE